MALVGRDGDRQHSCRPAGLRGSPRLRPRTGYRGLDALLLDHPRHDGESGLAGPVRGIRRGFTANAGRRLLPARLAERAAGQSGGCQAMAWLSEALRVARQIDQRFAEYFLLSGFGSHAASSGQARRAARLFGAAASMGAGAGADNGGPHAPFLAEAKESATRALGETQFGAEFDAG